MPEPMIYTCAECFSDVEPGEEIIDFGLVFCSESCRERYAEEYLGDD